MSPRKNRLSVLSVGALCIALLLLALPAQPVTTARAQTPPAPSNTQPTTAQTVVIELTAPSLADTYAALTASPVQAASAEVIAAATQAQLAQVDAAQLDLLDALADYDAEIIYRAQRAYNGIAVRVPADQVDALAALPGVKGVHPLVAKRPSHDLSVPFTGAPALWQGAGDLLPAGVTGEGITIAIVDTGVDYLHADFGGPATGYDANDPTRVDDAVPWPTAKVIGGYDFTGDDYNADYDAFDPDPARNGYQPIPQPDADPFDCYRHGTHVAGTAAGMGVTQAGASYRGGYGQPLDPSQFRIAPGVAPEAKIYALKVFGCTGSSEVVDLGIEWALDPNGDGDLADRADVINLSLGSNYGTANDSTALAAQNALNAGAIVVASAGNAGDVTFVTGTPGVVDGVISVAAMVDNPVARGLFPGTGSSFETLATFSSSGPRRGDGRLKPDVAAPGFRITSAGHGTGNGSLTISGTSMAAPHVAGAAALLRQLYPTWTTAEIKALLMNSARPEIRASFDADAELQTPTRAGAGTIDLVNAVRTTVLLFDEERPAAVSLSFGAPAVGDTLVATRSVRVVDKRPASAQTDALDYQIEFQEAVAAPGVEISLPEPLLSVPPGGDATFDVTLRVDGAALASAPGVLLDEATGIPRYRLPEAAGFLRLRPLLPPNAPTADEPVPVLPVHAAPRPVSTLRATTSLLDYGTAQRNTLPLFFDEAAASPGPGATIPPAPENSPAANGLVSAFDLLWQSGGTRAAHAHADLTHLGATSREQVGGERVLYFALATRAPWSTPNEVRFEIHLDVDNDGQADQILFNSDAEGYNSRFDTSDLLISALENVATEERAIELPLNGLAFDQAPQETHPFFSQVLILPVRVASLGLAGGQETVTFWVESFSVDKPLVPGREEEPVVRTPRLRYSVAQPLLLVGPAQASPLFALRSGQSLPVNFNVQRALAAPPTRGLLLLHHQNGVGNNGVGQVQVVEIKSSRLRRLLLPVVRNQQVGD